jgi:hypothetical protein
VQRVLDLATHQDEHRSVGDAARRYIQRERQWRNNAEQLLTLLPGDHAVVAEPVMLEGAH